MLLLVLAASAQTVPHLQGIFLSLNSANAGYSVSQWAEEFAAMADVNITFAAVRAALAGTSNSTEGGCILGTYVAYYPTTLTPKACYRPAEVMADGDSPLGRLLTGAARNNVAVHITPAMPHTPFAWPHSPVAEYFGYLASLEADAFEDVWAAFPEHHETITGVYTALEEWNGLSWVRDNESIATDYLQPLASRVHGASGQAKIEVWASPYYVGNLTLHPTALSPQDYAAFWRRVWELAPDFSFIALQDSRGWQGNSDEEVAAALAELQKAAVATGRQLWSNVELFEGWPQPCIYPKHCGRHPAPIERVIKQLASEDAVVGGRHVAWEWGTCLSPFTNENTTALYRDYKAYLEAGVHGQ
jgi:hypothetical protein